MDPTHLSTPVDGASAAPPTAPEVAESAPVAAKPAPKRQPLPAPIFARMVLVLVGLLWMVIGLWAFSDPAALGDSVEFHVRSDLARLEVRAMYGGGSLAMAALHFLAAIRNVWLAQALFASTLYTFGVFAGRLLSVAIDGLSSPFALMLMGTELVGIALCVFALWRLVRGGAKVG